MADARTPDETTSSAGPPPRVRRDLRGAGITLAIVGLMVAVALLAMVSATPGPEPLATDRIGARPAGVDLVVAAGAPVSWDPARIGDAASAAALSQVWEGLTTLDQAAQVRPALAAGWQVEEGGRRITFQLREGITFSDGTPITGHDVVQSWLRNLDPAHPSPLAGLLGDVVGAREVLAGTGRVEDVAIRADDGRVTVDFWRPASYFPAAAASPTLAVVPASLGDGAVSPLLPAGGLVVSGAYVPTAQDDGSITLAANPAYWAGAPAIPTIAMLTDTGGRSPVEVFQSGDADYVNVGPDDARWLAYDRQLGPQLRRNDDFSVRYYGFDTTRPPFDDVRVRRAVSLAVDWDRTVRLDDPDAVVATSIVPAGIALRTEEDLSPAHDPDAARAELAAAGYPGGAGLPPITMITTGGGREEAIAMELQRELGMTVSVETMPFDAYSDRLAADPPQIFSLDWIADYPHPHDFLGLLLESGSSANVGRWTQPAYDALLEAAASTADPAEQQADYTAAERIVRDEAPLIPLRYGESWALSREGLLGANQAGLGYLRFAGLAWDR